VFGFLLGAITLCRLDAVFLMLASVCLALAASAALKLPLRRCVSRVTALCAGFGICVTPYVVWNLASFGHIMPVSGAVKSCFPQIRHTLSFQCDMALGAVLLAVLLALAAAVAVSSGREGCLRRLVDSPLSILVLGCVFHFVYAFLFLAWGVYWWHFMPYVLAIAVVLAQVVERLTAHRPRIRRAVIGGLVCTMAAFAIATKYQEVRLKEQRHQAWREAAEWARSHTSADAVFGMNDAGLFGYFSERRVVNLDGKANGYEYLAALGEDDVEAYLRRLGVSYIASTHADYRAGKCAVVIPRANQPSARLWMDEAAEVYRGRAVPGGRLIPSGEVAFAICRYPS
jgi:hypothetical protein